MPSLTQRQPLRVEVLQDGDQVLAAGLQPIAQLGYLQLPVLGAVLADGLARLLDGRLRKIDLASDAVQLTCVHKVLDRFLDLGCPVP